MTIRVKGAIDLFPELADTNNIYRYVEYLNEDVQVFIKKCYEHAGYELTEEVNRVCEILMNYLIRKGHIDPNTHRHSLVDCLLMAALLHDVYYSCCKNDKAGSCSKQVGNSLGGNTCS